MQAELDWTRSCVDRLEDAARVARWHLDQIADRRAGMVSIWNDACAQAVKQRYLDPLAGEAADALADVGQASGDLHASGDAVERAHRLFETATQLARTLLESISEAQHVFRGIDQQADNVSLHVEASRHHVTRAHSLLAKAGRTGAG